MTDVALAVPDRTGARRLPAWLARAWPLLAILALGAIWTIWFVLRCKQYFIQPDELEYVKQSRQIADQLHPILPGERYFTSWSQLQPLLLAPVWALPDTNVAHQAMGIVNALVMVSAAIPAWLLARRVVPGARWAAPFVALMTVSVPWIASASTMMTEVVAYPAFLWGTLAVVNAVARPSARADVLALLGLGLAFSARPQLAVLAPALLVGVAAHTLREGLVREDGDLAPRGARLRRALREALWTHRVLAAAGAAALLVYAVARPTIFGGYADEGVTTGVVDTPGLLEFSREILAYVVVGVGVLPLGMAAGWALLTLWRPAGRDQHAFAVVATVAVAALTIAVGSFTARYTPQGINSRYLFYAAPLLFVGAAALVADRRRATLPLALGGLLTGWVVYGSALSQSGPSLVSPDQTFHTVLIGRTYQLGNALGMPGMSVPKLLGVLAIVGIGALVVARHRRIAQAAGLLALGLAALWTVAETGYSLKKIADTQAGIDPAFVEGRRWIDQTLPAGAEAEVILSTFGDASSAMGVWWDVSFWNAKAGRSMVTPTTPDLQQPYPTFFEVQAGTGLFQGPPGSGVPPGEGLGPGPYFVRGARDRTFGFTGERVVAERFGVLIVEVAVPARAAWAMFGAADDTGRVSAAPTGTLVRVFQAGAPDARAVRLTLAATADAQAPARFRVRAGDGFRARGAVAPEQPRTIEVPVRWSAEGLADVIVRAPAPEGQALPALEIAAVELTA